MEEILYKLLNSTTETEVLEFKKAERQFDKNKLGKYFSALSNEANLSKLACAWLILGVDNNKNIVGTSISDEQLNDYKREIANNTSPTFNFLSVTRITTDEGNVILMQIPPASQGIPVAWKNHYYARDGESLGGLSIEKIERIRNQSQNFDWSKEIVEDANIDDLDSNAITKAREQYLLKNTHLKEIIPNWDNATFLNKARLTIKGKITRTAIILLGKPESEHFISPSSSKITWILKDKDDIEKDYAHFTCPLIVEVEKMHSKIRIIKYRYIKNATLFPDEVDQYDPYIIREAINNCIAHQDYTLGGKINVVEREDGVLTFSNSGDFIPQTIERVIQADAPETEYRNPFLANAMVNLNMIDTIGSGIKRMFMLQKSKYFPLPEYNFANRKVTVSITGKVVDVNYARKLAQMPELTLSEIMLLDKVAKRKTILLDEITQLKDKKLIEGRKPNFYISSSVAEITDEKAAYIKQRGIDDSYYMTLIIEYLKQFKKADRKDMNSLLLEKLPDILSKKQKQNKVKNLLQKLRTENKIKLIKNKEWILDKL